MGIVNNVLAGASGNQGYFLSRSLRFRSSASAYLNRTPASAGNQKTWTWSAWIKRGSLTTPQWLFAGGVVSTDYTFIRFGSGGNNNDFLEYARVIGSAVNANKHTAMVFRDTSAWYHIVVVEDAANTVARIYVNGTETVYTTNTNPTNSNGAVNAAVIHNIGRYTGSNIQMFDGYMAEVHLIDGQALTPSSFGMNDPATGVWVPKKYTGTYGTNGFYLPFTDNSNNTATTIGKDFSGNGNNWTPNNISVTAGVTYDSMTDVPTLTSPTAANYAVINPLMPSANTISNGNLRATMSASPNAKFVSTMGVTSGKYYMEIVTSAWNNCPIGITANTVPQPYLSNADGSTSLAFWPGSGGTQLYINGSLQSWSGSATTWATNDIAGFALDATAKTIALYKNGSLLGTYDFSGLGWSEIYFAGGNYINGLVYDFNFGQRPFAYTPPSGFVALNTFNLPTPTIGATPSSQANKYFDAVTFNNQGGSYPKTVTGLNFQPDFVWIKSRTQAYPHYLFDSVRGTGIKSLSSNSTAAEGADGVTNLSSFNSNGFTAAAGDGIGDIVGVYWSWRANQGTNITNTAGSITSTVSANTTAGFSIVTYTGNGTAGATVGHGLGVAPSMIFAKVRSRSGDNWHSYHSALGGTQGILLNATNAASTDSGFWNNTNPSSTVITLGAYNTFSSQTYVAYCFSEVAGYSRFGSYTGNGSTDGVFVFTGFRPRYIMFKRTNTTEEWAIYDTARDSYNVAELELFANSSSAEYDGNRGVDILSNGFKLRSASGANNANGSTYIYAAFAESPFKYSLAR